MSKPISVSDSCYSLLVRVKASYELREGTTLSFSDALCKALQDSVGGATSDYMSGMKISVN